MIAENTKQNKQKKYYFYFMRENKKNAHTGEPLENLGVPIFPWLHIFWTYIWINRKERLRTMSERKRREEGEDPLTHSHVNHVLWPTVVEIKFFSIKKIFSCIFYLPRFLWVFIFIFFKLCKLNIENAYYIDWIYQWITKLFNIYAFMHKN